MSRALELALLQASALRAEAERALVAARRAKEVAQTAVAAAEARSEQARAALENFTSRACSVPWQRAQLDMNGLRAEVDDARAALAKQVDELAARERATLDATAALSRAQQGERVLERGIERAARPAREAEDE